VHYRTMIIHAD